MKVVRLANSSLAGFRRQRTDSNFGLVCLEPLGGRKEREAVFDCPGTSLARVSTSELLLESYGNEKLHRWSGC